jgi:hypothetical protein
MGRRTLGELIIGSRDPLPVLIGGDVAHENVIAAWTCALLGLADATCMDLSSAEPAARHAPQIPRRRPYPAAPASPCGSGAAVKAPLAKLP